MSGMLLFFKSVSRGGRLPVFLLGFGLLAFVVPASAQATQPPADSGMSGSMAGMGGHMHMSTTRPMQPGDRAKADAIVAAARQAMEPYKAITVKRWPTDTASFCPTFRSRSTTSPSTNMAARQPRTSIR